ncbi:MAG TPA: CoA-binding protein [Chitinophagaceae bacterium]|nr:CoA-binding protein [Chitinophagaceae bacterium]
MPEQKTTMVLGASDDPSRYAYLAINRLRKNGHPVIAIGKKPGKVADVEITKEKNTHTGVDTVTLYLNPTHQKQYYDYIVSLKPKRIIFNPGTENDELAVLAEQNGIKTMEACTLVMLSTGQY